MKTLQAKLEALVNEIQTLDTELWTMRANTQGREDREAAKARLIERADEIRGQM